VTPIAVDTNILVRLATGDSPAEYRTVTAALVRRPWLVFSTVLLETEWVLRSLYGYSHEQFAEFVDWMDGNERIQFAETASIRAAVAYHRAGMDFADSLHIAQTGGQPLLTLDKKLRNRAKRMKLRTETP
jgi:predicted nucleic-acid-binding protein